MEILTDCQFGVIQPAYEKIESLYSSNFPEHAK
jgi:hypothetical protein